MEYHFSKKSMSVDTDQLVRVFSGLLVSYMIWAPSTPYHKLAEDKKINLTKQYVNLLSSCWKQ